MSGPRPTKLKSLRDRITPEDELISEGHEPFHHVSITSVIDDAIESGVSPVSADDEEIPGEDDVLRAGDPDVDPRSIEYSGDEAAGGTNASPDDNDVDAIGRLYGVLESDRPDLVLGEDLIAPRDRARWENDPASRDEQQAPAPASAKRRPPWDRP